MNEISESPCCGNCLWYDGDERDNEAYCINKEIYVSANYFCYIYSETDYFEKEE